MAPEIKPSWTGSITFGLVAVPVKLYPAVESHVGPELHMYHREDAGRVRMHRFCEAEGREVEYGDLAKGWESGDGRMVVLTDEDFETLPIPSKRIVDVLSFIPADQVDPLLYDTPYFVGLGDKAPSKPYILLRDVMRDSGLVAITKITMRERESLAVLRVLDDVLLLQTIRWPDEIRSSEGIKAPEADEPVDKREIKMALQYAAARSEGYDLEAERDAYVIALNDAIKARAEDHEPEHEAKSAARPAPVLDLMAALKASIDETQAGREAAAKPAKKAPAKKTAAKRAPRKAG